MDSSTFVRPPFVTKCPTRWRQRTLRAVVGLATAALSSAVAVQSAEAPAVALQGTCTPSVGFTKCVTFDSIGADYIFTVPTNVAGPVAIKAWGGGGGGVNPTYSSAQPGGGAGGFAGGNLSVPGGTQLTIMVGGGGHTWRPGVSPGRTYGGGGSGGTGGLAGATPLGQPGSSGGGLSGVFVGSISAANAAVIAGGGGGSSPGADKTATGSTTRPSVGGGGGINADSTVSGQSGTATAGGAAATASAPAPCPTAPTAGSQLLGGTGGGTPSGDTEGGGGGGGGWFGGGGGRCQLTGGSDPQNGPGGGGSSFIGGAGVSNGVTLAGGNAAIAATPGAAPNTGDSHYLAGVAAGGSGGGGTTGFGYGGPGYVVVQYNLQAACLAPTSIVVSPSAPTSIAQGMSASFTMTGGTVAASALPPASYTWSVSPAAGVTPSSGTGISTGNLTFATTGNHTVTFTATNTSSPPYCAPAAVAAGSVAQAVSPASADVSVAIVSPSLVPGTSGTATVTVANAGPSYAAGPLTAIYTPPVGLEIESSPSACTGNIPAGPLTCTVEGPLASTGTAVVSIAVRVPANATPSSTLAGGSVSASSSTADPSASNNNVPTDVAVKAGVADLGVAVTIAPISPALSGEAVISVSNAGPSDAAGPVVVTFTPPSGTSIASLPTGCVGTIPSGPLTCTVVGPMAPSSRVVINVPLAMAPSATIGEVVAGGSATAQSPTRDPASANNTAAAPVTVGPGFDLIPDITTVGPLVPGNTAHIELTVSNNGDGLASGASLTVTLPAGLTFVRWERLQSTTNALAPVVREADAVASSGGQSVTYGVGDLDAHTVARIVLVAEVALDATPGEVTFVLDAAAARGTEVVVANNRAMVVASIQGQLPATGQELSGNVLELGALLLVAGAVMNVIDRHRRMSRLLA
jgi:uncharacterized repeat protein (TIGR01451 family)